jgi:hypothetical protein
LQKFEQSQQAFLYSHFDDSVLDFFGTLFQDAHDAAEDFLSLISRRVIFQVVSRDI